MFAAQADTWIAPVPFEVWSADGSYVFRFDPYETSALYTADDVVVYTVEGLRSHAYENDFFFSNDMRRFIFIPQADHEIALEKFNYGERVSTAYIADLVDDMSAVTHSVSIAFWRNWEPEWDAATETLTVTTIDGLTYHFGLQQTDVGEPTQPPPLTPDLPTVGALVEPQEESTNPRWWVLFVPYLMGVVALAAVVFLIVVFAVKRK